MPKENIRALSRSVNAYANYVVNEDGHNYPDLFSAISAGCLQRIADSLEKMDVPVDVLKQTIQDKEDKIKYLKGVVYSKECNITTLLRDLKKVKAERAKLKKQLKDGNSGS